MITYTYRCKSCSHEFEILQKITDDKLVHCPQCQEDMLERIIPANPFILKGDGWESNEAKGKWHDPGEGKR